MIVNKIINVVFKGVEFNPTGPDDEDNKSLDFSVGGKDLGWIIGPTSPMLTKKCKYELVIYTDTIDDIKDLAPLFRKKLFFLYSTLYHVISKSSSFFISFFFDKNC